MAKLLLGCVCMQFKDDVPPRYADAAPRHSRARLDYELGPGSSQYGEAYGDRCVMIILWL